MALRKAELAIDVTQLVRTEPVGPVPRARLLPRPLVQTLSQPVGSLLAGYRGREMPKQPEWNAAIGDWYFGTRSAGRPVYLSLDEEVIVEMAREQGWDLVDPVADFEAALRVYVSPHGSRPFRIWAEAGDRWRKKPLESLGHPPFLAFLGATVLAATRESPGKLRKQGRPAYYDPLRTLFNLGGEGTIPGYYPDVPNMWRWLNEWLTATGGEHGLPTAYAPKTHDQHIGFSLSQAVLLSSDRARLTDFFDAIGADPRSEVASAELLARLRRWVAGPGRATARMRKALDDPNFSDILGDILATELLYWDGTILDKRGLRVARVLPHIDAYRARLDSVAFIPAGIGERTVRLDNGEIEVPAGPRFIHFPAPCRLSLVDADSWVTGDLRFREDVDPVMVFRPDDDVGGWVPVRRAQYGESHYVLVHDSAHVEVASFFRQHVPGDVKEVTKVQLPGGWHLYRDVVLTTSSVLVAPPLRPLLPRSDQMPELVGGLCVDGHRSMYLADAAPDVLVPGFEHELNVALDGVVIAAVQGTGDLICLADRCLSLGVHHVQVGSTSLRFTLVASRVDWPQEAHIAHNLHRSDSGYAEDRTLGPPLDGADVSVSGAAVLSAVRDPALEPDPPMMVRVTAGRYLALGPRGFSAEVRVEQPDWARRRGLLFNAFELVAIERQVPFPVVWVVRRFKDRAEVLHVAKLAEKLTASPDPDAWKLAVEELLSSPLSIADDLREAWEDYITGGTDDD